VPWFGNLSMSNKTDHISSWIDLFERKKLTDFS